MSAESGLKSYSMVPVRKGEAGKLGGAGLEQKQPLWETFFSGELDLGFRSHAVRAERTPVLCRHWDVDGFHCMCTQGEEQEAAGEGKTHVLGQRQTPGREAPSPV